MLSPGDRIGRYEVVSSLAAGGMGEVYRARDRELQRDVALKILPEELCSDPDRLRRFEREAKATAALSHPNVLTVFDVGHEGGRAYIVLEMLQGSTLADVMKDSALRTREALDYAAQVARGLAAAHARGIVHRDLKPANLFLTTTGVVKILDFGLARIGGAGSQSPEETTAEVTGPGLILGTVSYMSPEQARGEPSDARSDLFTLGTVLYEMLSGRHPFKRASSAETVSAILRDEPPELVGLEGIVPPPVERLARRCLEKRPEDRFQTASDLAIALDLLAGGQHTGTRHAPGRRRLALLGALAALLAVVAALYSGTSRKQPLVGTSRVDSLAVLPLANLMGDPEQEYLVAGMHEALIAELGQISALSVISRTSVTRYRNTDRSLPEIARELHVDALVEGSVFRSGDSMRIQVHLIAAAAGERRLWSGAYEGELRNILALQKRAAREIAAEIRVRLTPQEAARLATARTVAPAAYDAWARGWFQFTRLTPASLSKCLEYAGAALAIDPSYAAAHSLAASCHGLLPNIASVESSDASPKAEAAARRALELDEGLADAHVALAWVLANYHWDWAGAEREFRRGLELNPSSAFGHSRFGWFLSWLGRGDEALVEVKRAAHLNPVDPYQLQATAAVHYVARRYDDAIVAARRAIEIDPNYAFAYGRLGRAYTGKGMHEEAVAALGTAVKLGGGVTHQGGLGRAYALAGRGNEARLILDRLIDERRRGHGRSIPIATIHAALGERDAALRWLEDGYRLRDANMVLLKVFPEWDGLRADPRFDDLMRRMKFPQ